MTPPPSSLAGCRLSPAVLRLQPFAASVPYTVAGAQCWVLRRRGVAGGRAEGSPAAEPCAPEGSPPARVVRKTEGPMDGQGKGEDVGSQKRAAARPGEARCGAVRLPRCPSPRWPEAQCDVTVIPGRQAGPRALGPRATKPAKRSQPVRARTLNHTHTCSGRFVQLVRNVKDPDPLCLAQDPTPFRLKLPRARTYNLTKLPGRSRRNASHRAAQAPGATRLPPPLRPGGGEKHRAAREERIQKKRQEKLQEESGGERLEGEGGGERREMRNLSEQRRAGEGRKQGWAKAGRRWNAGRWRSAEARGTSLEPGPQPPPPLQESLFAPLAPSSLRAASVDLLFWPSFVLGVLAPRPRTAAPSGISMTRSLLGS